MNINLTINIIQVQDRCFSFSSFPLFNDFHNIRPQPYFPKIVIRPLMIKLGSQHGAMKRSWFIHQVCGAQECFP